MDKDGVRKELETILKNYGIYEGNDIPFDDENVADLIARLEAFVALQADKAVQDARIDELEHVICHKHGFGKDSCRQIKDRIAELKGGSDE